MADTKISLLTAASAAAGANEIAINEAGTSKKISVDQLADYIIKKISGSSGAAGAYRTLQRLSANATANSTTTLNVVMTTTGLGAGTWKFKFTIIYQAGATTTGVNFSINHTGTVTKVIGSTWYVTNGGANAVATADQATDATANLVEGKAMRANNTGVGTTLGVDTLNADCMVVFEGIIVVTVSGDLQLKHASEVAASSQVMADTCLELEKVA